MCELFAGQLLGFQNYIPPYSRTRGSALLRGVNYASGAAGIRDETGNNLVKHRMCGVTIGRIWSYAVSCLSKLS